MFIANLLTALFLAGLGAIIKFAKASWLISGYNTSSKEEKAKYDEEALCNFVGNLLFVLGGIIFLIGAAALLELPYFNVILSVGWALFTIITVAAVIYMNTGSRFKKSR